MYENVYTAQLPYMHGGVIAYALTTQGGFVVGDSHAKRTARY
jgi:hypothetical protein